MKIKISLKNLYSLIGKKIFFLIIFGLTICLFWFISDYLLVYVFQYFLVSIGAISVGSELKILIYSLSPNLNKALIFLIFFGFIKMTIQALKIYNSQSLYENVSAHLKKKILLFVAQNPYWQSSHETIAMFTERTSMASNFILQFFNLIFFSTMTGALFITCLLMCPKETFVAFSIIVFLILPLRFFNSKIKTYGDQYTNYQKNIYRKIITGLKNINLLVVYNKTYEEFQKGVEDIDGYKDSAVGFYGIYGIKTSFPFFVGILSISITSFISIKFFKTPPHLLAPFFYLFIRACQNLGEVNGCLGEITKLKSNFFYILDWHTKNMANYSNNPTLNLLHQHNNSPRKDIEIIANEVTFSYSSSLHDQLPIIQNLYFHISTGDIFLIKGRSGTGKSTLLKLITGFLAPSKGEILMNGISTPKLRNDISEIIGYVGPDNYFFEGTIKENLLYLNSNSNLIDDDLIFHALSKAHILNEVQCMKNGIYQQINESVEFSTGQKQRLSIARAMLRQPRILILDEATANLDIQSELEILNTLKELQENMITIIISHKSTFDTLATKSITL